MMLYINYTSIKTGKKSKEILALHILTYIHTYTQFSYRIPFILRMDFYILIFPLYTEQFFMSSR